MATLWAPLNLKTYFLFACYIWFKLQTFLGYKSSYTSLPIIFLMKSSYNVISFTKNTVVLCYLENCAWISLRYSCCLCVIYYSRWVRPFPWRTRDFCFCMLAYIVSFTKNTPSLFFEILLIFWDCLYCLTVKIFLIFPKLIWFTPSFACIFQFSYGIHISLF